MNKMEEKRLYNMLENYKRACEKMISDLTNKVDSLSVVVGFIVVTIAISIAATLITLFIKLGA